MKHALIVFLFGIMTASAQQTPAVLVYPTNGQQNVLSNATFQWSTAPNAQAYYLYVGTTQGAKDVVNTGAIQGTTYTPKTPLPTGATLWARIWTDINGTWLYQRDVSFTVSSDSALVCPVNGQQNVPQSSIFQWTTDPGAQAYYLYVGTTQGAKDVVNTGPIQGTTYTPKTPLPVGATLWARIWTNINGTWVYQQDISFTVSTDSVLISPTNGQQNVLSNATFQWSTAPNAQAYYLYVGTTQGAKDVVNTGAIQGTTYTPKTLLPAGATLWARLWTSINGFWVYQQDVNFTVSPAAILLSPTSGQQNVLSNTTFQWTTVPGALGYYLWVGTTQGAKDVVNTGSIPSTSYATTSPLPPGTTLWARIWTNINGTWMYQQDVSFTVSPHSVLTYPINGQVNIDTTVAFQWTPQANVQAYYLYVGSSPGAKDLVNTGEIQATSWPVPPLPVGQTLYARLWTEINGIWSYSYDVSFTATMRFGYPAIRSVDIDPTVAFSWSPASGGNGTYELSIGTTPGGNDVYSNAQIQAKSFTVPTSSLPTGTVLYAQISVTPGDGTERKADTVFTVAGTTVAPSQIVYPANGATNADVSLPFQWTPTDMAQAYRLEVSNTSGLVVDSGAITVPRYFAETLAVGPYTGQLGTEIGGQWYWTSFLFTVTNTGSSMTNELASALWATDYVRNMADAQNYAYSWTALESNTEVAQLIWAVCPEYRNTLLYVLAQMNVTARLPAAQQPQYIDIAFIWNSYDSHTLVEFWNTDQQRWMLLDPTFDMTMVNVSDGTYATMEDMQAATRNQQWTAIKYQYLGAWGNSIAKGYYLDYPLLYLNIPPVLPLGQGENPMPYLIQPTGPPVNQYGYYYFQCSGSTTMLVNGSPQQVVCNGIDSLSLGVFANTLALPSGSTSPVTIYSPVRNVF